jgi:hypothetical protein
VDKPSAEELAMKRLPFGLLLLAIFVTIATVRAEPPQVKIVMSPASTIPKADLLKNLGDKCPNVSLVLDSTKSDYMLEAAWWAGEYKFTLFKKGGDAVYSTSTHMLSNAVKDVCHYVNSQASVTPAHN